MATETVPATQPTPLDIESAFYAVAHMTALGQWIEAARRVVDEVEVSRRINPELDALLREHDIRSAIPWDEEESNGLCMLLSSIREAVRDVWPKREEAAHG